MAAGLSAFTVMIGAAIGGGWAATMTKAKDDLAGLTAAERRSRELSRAAKPLDLTALEANKAAAAQAKKALDEYRASLVQIGPPTEEQAATLKLLEASHGRHEKAVRRSSAAIAATEARLKAEGKDVAKVRAEYEKEQRTLQRSIDLHKSLNRAVESGKRFGRTLAVTGAALYGAGRGLFALARGAADYADETVDNAAKLGMSTRALQQWQFAATTADMSSEKFNDSVWKLSLGLDEALRKGSGSASEALQRLGLDVRALWALPADQRLDAIADALSRVDDAGARASISAALFGKDGGKGMAELLSSGSAEIEKYRKRAEELGLVMDPERIAPLKNKLTVLGSLFAGLGRSVGVALAPKVGEFVDKLLDSGPALMQLGTNIGKSLANVAPVLLGALSAAGKLFGVLARYPALTTAVAYGVGAFGAALAGVRLWQFGRDAIAVGKALWGMRNAQLLATGAQWGLNTAMAAAPIGGLVVQALALGAALYAANKFMQGWDDPDSIERSKYSGGNDFNPAAYGADAKSVWKNLQSIWDTGAPVYGWTPAPWNKKYQEAERQRMLQKQSTPPAQPAVNVPPPVVSPVQADKPAAAPVINSPISFHITQQPGEDGETLAQRVAVLIDRQQRGLLDSALADIA